MVTMLVTGSGSGNEQIEIVKENGDTIDCPQMTNYPLGVEKAAGASFSDKTTVVCGGSLRDNESRDDCYKLTNSKWESFGKLQTARFDHAATRIGGDSIWFTGGHVGKSGRFRLPTTEILNLDGTITSGPNLPQGREGHCQVSYGQTTFIIGTVVCD